MTLAEKKALEGRIASLEHALADYMHVVDLCSFKVEGDLRYDFLSAYAGALAVVPRELYRPAKPMRAAS
jgi:hypothetical protein